MGSSGSADLESPFLGRELMTWKVLVAPSIDVGCGSEVRRGRRGHERHRMDMEEEMIEETILRPGSRHYVAITQSEPKRQSFLGFNHGCFGC